jgi:hypothetical protein
MTWIEALEALAGDFRVGDFTRLCNHPSAEVRDAWRAKVVRIAQGDRSPRPGLGTTIVNAVAAAGRVVGAAVRGKRILRGEAAQAACLAVCKTCDQYDAARDRCKICTCFASIKSRLATEECPRGLWPLREG